MAHFLFYHLFWKNSFFRSLRYIAADITLSSTLPKRRDGKIITHFFVFSSSNNFIVRGAEKIKGKKIKCAEIVCFWISSPGGRSLYFLSFFSRVLGESRRGCIFALCRRMKQLAPAKKIFLVFLEDFISTFFLGKVRACVKNP